ncbi:MAG: hypothetical protein JNJ58_12040 [Chitinophagaceae bacterium]|nr:hypothetical protein [Chitinophagaceae bacterium]
MKNQINIPLTTYSILLLLCLCSLQGVSQSIQPRFVTYTTAEGLSDQTIKCLLQDREGFLWVGTEFGLNKFDGTYFQTFLHQASDTLSICGNKISDLLEDRDGNLWVATKDAGVCKLEKRQGRVQWTKINLVIHGPILKSVDRINCLFDYNDEYIIAGAELVPVIFIHKKTLKASYWIPRLDRTTWLPLKPSLAEKSFRGLQTWVHQFGACTNGDLLMSILGTEGIYCVSKNKGIKVATYTQIPPFKGTYVCFINEGDTLYSGGWANGMAILYEAIPGELKPVSNTRSKSKFVDIPDEVTSITKYNDSLIVAGTKNSGLYIYHKYTGSLTHYAYDKLNKNSVASNAVNCVYKGREGILWVGTRKGLCMYSPRDWNCKTIPLTPPNSNADVTMFNPYEDEDGTLYVCSSSGLFVKRKTENEFKWIALYDQGKSLSPTLITRLSNGQYILGSESGFFYFDRDRLSIRRFEPYHFLSNEGKLFNQYQVFQVRSILEDTLLSQPTLVTGVLGYGIYAFHQGIRLVTGYYTDQTLKSSLKDNMIRKIIQDKDRNYYVATANGLFFWKLNRKQPKNDFAAYQAGSGLSNNDIRDLYCDEENNIWVATYGGGLNLWNGQSFQNFLSPRTRGNIMLGILPSRNHLWITTADGMEVFDKGTKQFYHVTINDGTEHTKLTSYIDLLKDSSLAFAVNNQLLILNPSSFDLKPVNSLKPYLIDFKVMQQSYPVDSTSEIIKLRNQQNYVELSFSALHFQSSQQRSYAYKLEGADQDWIQSKEGHAAYTGLPPGEYQFYAKVSDAYGVFSQPASLLQFEILPPFYNTWWFYTLCILGVAVLIYTFVHYRVRQLLQIQHIRNKIASDLHDEIGSALSSISMGSQLVETIMESDQDKAHKILERIKHTSKSSIESMSDIVWAITPKNDQGLNMIQKIQQIGKDLLEVKGIRFDLQADAEFNRLILGMHARKNMILIIKEAIHNIAKYSECKSVILTLALDKEGLILTITDDGKGMDMETIQHGHGIYSMQQRAKELSARFDIVTASQKGCTIRMHIPTTRLRD